MAKQNEKSEKHELAAKQPVEGSAPPAPGETTVSPEELAKEQGVTKEQVEALIGTNASPAVNEDKTKEKELSVKGSGAGDEAFLKAVKENEEKAEADKKAAEAEAEEKKKNALHPTPPTGATKLEKADAPAIEISRQMLRELVDAGDIDVPNEGGYVNNKTGQKYYL